MTDLELLVPTPEDVEKLRAEIAARDLALVSADKIIEAATDLRVAQRAGQDSGRSPTFSTSPSWAVWRLDGGG